MALTDEDLNNITRIVDASANRLEKKLDNKLATAVAGLGTKDELDIKLAAAVSGLATKADLDRMESRLTTSMTLLERDTFIRLDQHEARITRLEQARP